MSFLSECGFFEVPFGTADHGITVTFFGGPYRRSTPERRVVRVKMAAEINMDFDVSVPTADFSTPDPRVLEKGILDAITMAGKGNDVFVGCMGGIGRTGLFLAVLAKALLEVGKIKNIDPISYVRRTVNPHAVETAKQRDFVMHFDTSRIRTALLELDAKFTAPTRLGELALAHAEALKKVAEAKAELAVVPRWVRRLFKFLADHEII